MTLKSKFILSALCASVLSLSVPSAATTALGWQAVEDSDMSAMTRDVFQVYTPERKSFKMRLIKVESQSLGEETPANLTRTNGFSAVFVAPANEMQALLESGHQIVSVYHPELGTADVFIGAFKREDGRVFIEAVFN